MSKARQIADGTRYVDAAGGDRFTGSLHMDSDPVGLGSSNNNPGTRYNISSTSIADIHIVPTSQGTSTSVKNHGITFSGSPADLYTQGGLIFTQNSNDGTSVGLFTTDAYATGPQLGLSVEPQGFVVTPRSPWWYAWADLYYPTSTSTSEGFWANLTNNPTNVATGSSPNYNSSTGKFTAPVTGKYFVTTSYSRSGGNAVLEIYKNNSPTGMRALSYGTDWQTAAVSEVVNLSAGDTVGVHYGATNSTTVSGYRIHFSGFLIG